MKKPFSFSVDLVDACNLKCVNCPRGIYYKESTSARMDVALFGRIFDKIKSECKCTEIELHNWTEPFLHPELDKFIYEARQRGIRCLVSSNFSFRKPALIESVLAQKPVLIVSVSGFRQEVHELYHKGSNIELVKENLKAVEAFRAKTNLKFRAEVHFLQFIDNEEDGRMWEKFCNEHGFIFNAKVATFHEAATPENVSRLIWKPAFEELANGELKSVRRWLDEPSLEPCFVHNKIPIDCRGDAYVCCIYWNTKERKIGNYLDMSLEDIQRARLSNRECAYCTGMRKPQGSGMLTRPGLKKLMRFFRGT